jgi:hypothetical protein
VTESRDVALLRAYRETAWIIPSLDTTLRLHDAGAARLLLEQLACGAAAIITACNPYSKHLADDINAQRNQALTAELVNAGYRVIACVGVGVGADVGAGADAGVGVGAGSDKGVGTWEEESLLVPALTFDAAIACGQKWKQNCVVWIDAAGARLVVTAEGFAGQRTGTFVPAAS